MESYSLLEINQNIRDIIKENIPDLYWIVAEINELQVNSTGHCYMELIEKANDNNKIIAKARANIWAYQFRMLSPYFKSTTGIQLKAGIKVMIQASVEFHEVYGLSLQVVDINPAFTIGDLAMQKQEILKKLKEEGVFDMNRELDFPLLPKRIAVISSKSAAGYGDFVNQLNNNIYGYAFKHRLFQAIMQGNEAEVSIVRALEQIFEAENEFDVVAIIRGGGSQSDLNCFNSYELAASIAQFPLPVITGIGHERDETIADLVACVTQKTPTAVAEFIVHQVLMIDKKLENLSANLNDITDFVIRKYKERLQHLSRKLLILIHSYARTNEKKMHLLQLKLVNETVKYIQGHMARVNFFQKQVEKITETTFYNQKFKIIRLEEKIQILDPANLLKRGYSITKVEGKVIRNAKNLKKGQIIETIMHNGKIESIVK